MYLVLFWKFLSDTDPYFLSRGRGLCRKQVLHVSSRYKRVYTQKVKQIYVIKPYLSCFSYVSLLFVLFYRIQRGWGRCCNPNNPQTMNMRPIHNVHHSLRTCASKTSNNTISQQLGVTLWSPTLSFSCLQLGVINFKKMTKFVSFIILASDKIFQWYHKIASCLH